MAADTEPVHEADDGGWEPPQNRLVGNRAARAAIVVVAALGVLWVVGQLAGSGDGGALSGSTSPATSQPEGGTAQVAPDGTNPGEFPVEPDGTGPGTLPIERGGEGRDSQETHGAGALDPGSAALPLSGSWRPIPAAPVAPRAFPHSAWTGSELVIWGGTALWRDGLGGSTVYDDGAAYDPSTDTWRTIAPAPIAGRIDATVEWTGSEMLVWGGSVVGGEMVADGAAYEPVADRWRVLPDPPIVPRALAATAWTGDELVVIGGLAPSERDGPRWREDGVAYSPTHDRWRRIVSAGEALGPGNPTYAAAWSGEEVLVWSGRAAGAYDPALDRWRPLPQMPPGRSLTGPVFWTNQVFTIPFMRVDEGDARGFGVRYDPSQGVWAVTDPAPSAIAGLPWPVEAGNRIVFLPSSEETPARQPLSWDPASDTWARLPAAPEPRFWHTTTWTGEELIVWGGIHGSGARNDGASWRP